MVENGENVLFSKCKASGYVATMINLGIVIAVSNYSGDAIPLPACERDGQAIATLMRSDARFNEVLLIAGDARSSIVKPRLIEFLGKFKGKEIGDVAFYFSGHGDFSGDDFYYLLEDYEQKRRKQTSLENTELDGLIRAISPVNFVKIVDACHSGVAYIKSSDELDEYLKAATGRFKKLYFMFSSQTEQSSYQDSNLSYFTRRLIEAIIEHQAPTIRYKEIMDFISDAFAQDNAQTPFFVIQADLTETFCEVSDATKIALKEFLPQTLPAISGRGSGIPSLADLIKADAQHYCTKEEALDAVGLVSDLLNKTPISGDLQQLFNQNSSVISNAQPAGAISIARWFDQSKDDRRYFVDVIKEMKSATSQTPRNPYSSLRNFLNPLGMTDYETTTTTRQVVTGFRSTVELPFSFMAIYADPKFPNLNLAACYVVPFVSMTHLRLFWAFVNYEKIAWDDRRIIGDYEWKTEEVPLKASDQIRRLTEMIVSEFSLFIEAPIKAKWPEQGAKDIKDVQQQNEEASTTKGTTDTVATRLHEPGGPKNDSEVS